MDHLKLSARRPDYISSLELQYSSIHESGHVLAARHFGFEVAWVSIDTDFINSDPLAIANDCAGEGVLGVAMTRASKRMKPFIDRGFIQARGERAILHEYCIEAVCGPYAEKLVNPAWSSTAGNDFGQAQYFLRTYSQGTRTRHDRHWADIKSAASRFVTTHEALIRHFAFILMSEKTILAHDIDLRILEAKRRASQFSSDFDVNG